MLHVKIGKPYWLSKEGLEYFEGAYKATFIGCWAIKQTSGNWSEAPADIFYVANPDKKYTNYFGIFFNNKKQTLICNGLSAFAEPLAGILDGDEVKISRYQRDIIEGTNGTIEGGRDYIRITGDPVVRTVIVEADKFIITGTG